MGSCTKHLAALSSLVLLFGIAPVYAGDESKAPPVPAAPVFAPTPPVETTERDFDPARNVVDDAATQLPGLCSLAEFRALPENDRHVYSFDPWPGETDELGAKQFAFNFRRDGASTRKIAFIPNGGGPGGVKGLGRSIDPVSKKPVLRGFGNLDWSGKSTHVFKFDKPVLAFGVVLRSTGDFELRKFFWPAARELNGYPVSYTLADGSIVQLGARELRGALLKADTNAFVGVIDRSGRGIVSVTYTIRGLAGNKAQAIHMSDMAFATLPRPKVSPVINLRSRCDFELPERIVATPANAAPGLTTLDAFRFIVGTHRYVYRFDTWPTSSPELAKNELAFDLKGKGEIGQTVAIRATNSANDAKPSQATLKDDASEPYPALGGLGEVAKDAWAEQTFTFSKPVWSVGVTYRSGADLKLASAVTFTRSDGSTGALGEGGTIGANTRTYVGVTDTSDKGISSVTFRVQGTTDARHPVYIEDLAFALAGPPPGEWKLTAADEFDGDSLNPQMWSTGYKFVDVINNELQAFVPENVIVKDGVCTIKVEKREALNTDRFGNTRARQQFASGAFTSVDKFTQTYGYFEARIKMPKARGAGVWPAFWMLPDRGRAYPDRVRYGYMSKLYGKGAEIDIFEFMPAWKKPDGTFPIHHGTIWDYGPVTEKSPAPHGYGAYALDNDGWGPAELGIPGLDEEFHTYGLYWSPERLIFYVDSKPVFRVKDPNRVPDVPHFFLFNVSVHLNAWGKTPDKKQPTMQQIIDDMPNAMQIDYFRAYSGVLEEPTPTPPSDIPGPVTKYAPPAPGEAETPATQPAAPPAPVSPGAPAAPVNSGISTPSTG